MWMAVAGAGGVFGLIALAGIVWAFRKLESPKKFGAIAGFCVLGLVGAYMAVNATAIAVPEEAAAINAEVEAATEDFDAPFDDDF
ncbi:MAG: hypothetical protein ACI9KE_005813 [Polyangiales bacterium]|jgi:hypothetical protein